jgi:hypothetical protein
MARAPVTSVFDRAVLAIAGMFALAAGIFAAGARVPDTETAILARQKAIDPPQLWLVDALGEDGAVKGSVFVCADTAIRETFVRARAEVNGAPCRDTTSPVVKPNGWALSCVANGQPFAVSAATFGDPQRDFRLDFALTPLKFIYPPPAHWPATVRQLRHFRRIGDCPNGWRIGDQAKPGRRPRHA